MPPFVNWCCSLFSSRCLILIHSGFCVSCSKVLTLSLSKLSSLCGRSFHTLCSDKTMCSKVRPRWKSSAWSHQADRRGNEHVAAVFPFTPLPFTSTRPHLSSPPPSPLPPSLFLSHSFAPGIELIIQKVTCGLLLSPLPSFSLLQWETKKRKKKKRQKQAWGSFNPDHPGQVIGSQRHQGHLFSEHVPPTSLPCSVRSFSSVVEVKRWRGSFSGWSIT